MSPDTCTKGRSPQQFWQLTIRSLMTLGQEARDSAWAPFFLISRVTEGWGQDGRDATSTAVRGGLPEE